MTMTVKFPPELESGLRRHAEAAGVSASLVIREAVAQYLVNWPAAAPSAHALGAGLFGKFSGPPTLSIARKATLAEAWADKQVGRSSKPPR